MRNFVRNSCGYRWTSTTLRMTKYLNEESKEQRSATALVLLRLSALNFKLIFVDEFSVNNYLHSNYNWCKTGELSCVPATSF